MSLEEPERLRRWRLVLGEEAEEWCGPLPGEDLGMDRALAALYNADRAAGLGASSPVVHRWLGDIRKYFPRSTVQVMQKDALERLGLKQLLLEPEMLQVVEPDVHLVATLLSLKGVIPARTRDTARQVVNQVVTELERRLRNPLVQAVRGSLSRASRTNRPRPAEIDWHRTIRRNLRHYIPERKTIVAERLAGWGRRSGAMRDVILCVDQSGSMAPSVVYSGIFAAVLASIRAVSTSMVVFDTSVVDLTQQLHDPIELLFSTQLGGGTDINRALAYCQTLVLRPAQTVLVLITDLFEGGNAQEMVQRAAALVTAGVTVVCLLALSDEGSPAFDPQNAARLAALGIPAFACTPDQFPDLMAAAIQRRDLGLWAAQQGIHVRGRAEGGTVG
jgi:Mg-chelatase subunit ChlD